MCRKVFIVLMAGDSSQYHSYCIAVCVEHSNTRSLSYCYDVYDDDDDYYYFLTLGRSSRGMKEITVLKNTTKL